MYYQNETFLLNYAKIKAGKKIWSFYYYQTLLNEKIKEITQQLDPKIQTVLQLKEKKDEMGISIENFKKVCTKSLEHKAGLLQPLILLNSLNIKNNLEYFCGILSILHYSCLSEKNNYIQQVMMNKDKLLEQKKIFKILNLIFHSLSQQLKDLIKYQLLICLDTILIVLVQCSKEMPFVFNKLREYQNCCRIVSCKQNYKGISLFIEMVSSFDLQLQPSLTDHKIDEVLDRILQQMDCVICFQSMIDPVSLKCGHSFCKKCVDLGRQYSQKCPICRFEQKDNALFIENNQFLINLIQHRKDIEQNINLEDDKIQDQVQNQIAPQQIKQFNSLLLLQTNQNLKMLIEQVVEINMKQFSTLKSQQIQHILQNNPIFILYSEKSQETYIAENKLANISKKKIMMIVEILEIVQIGEVVNETIQINIEGMEDYLLEVQTAKAISLPDEEIDLQNSEVQECLINKINKIKLFFDQVLNSQNGDETFQIVNTFLSKSGFLSLQSNDILSQYDLIRKYSFLLPNILNIPEKEKILIQKEKNILRRLQLLENSIQRFSQITNILMIFKIQQLKLEKRSYQYLLYIFIGLIILFFF